MKEGDSSLLSGKAGRKIWTIRHPDEGEYYYDLHYILLSSGVPMP
jgi:hypothetical protein